MRIVSPYKDYYDSVQSVGQDQTMVYVRKPTEVSVSKKVFPFDQFGDPLFVHWSNASRGYHYAPDIKSFIIGFCGKIYGVLVIDGFIRKTIGPSSGGGVVSVENGSICYNIDDVDKHIEPKLKSKALDEYYLTKSARWYKGWKRYYPYGRRRETLEEFFAKCEEMKNKFESLFIEHKCPIFVATKSDNDKNWQVVLNGFSVDPARGLSVLEFFRVFDPYSTFQELQMYFGNIAQPNRPIPEVSDKDLIVAKGFDKHSFRKESKKK